MHLIPLTPKTKDPIAVTKAEALVVQFNHSIQNRVREHREGFQAVWRDYTVTPDDLIAAWGPRACYMLGAAQENLRHIGTLAALLGQTLDDFIKPEDYEPVRGLTPNADGTVTIAPIVEGFDAWGRKLPLPLTQQQIMEARKISEYRAIPSGV